MKKKLLFALLGLSFMTGTNGQQYFTERPEFIKANSNWVLGGSGINFSSGTPSVFAAQPGAHNFGEASATVSDTSTGQLLFYTDGLDCFDRNHQPMPNGGGLLGHMSTAQGACIVPVIGREDQYYLFCLNEGVLGRELFGGNLSSPDLTYSIVDMSLNNGLGDIVAGQKNIVLAGNVATWLSESMIAIPGDNCDIWLVVHKYEEPTFLSFRITESGIDTIPVISSTSSALAGTLAYGFSQMSVSPNREMLSIASQGSLGCMIMGLVPSSGGAMVCQFNAATGEVGKDIKLHDTIMGFGSCFSPDGKKLYISGGMPDATLSGVIGDHIYQYDVSIFDSSSILSSRQLAGSTNDSFQLGMMRTASDGKIYITVNELFNGGLLVSGYRITAIQQPNLPGTQSNYSIQKLLEPINHRQTLGNDVVYPLSNSYQQLLMDTNICSPIMISAAPSYANYVWEDQSTTTERTIDQSGIYWVQYYDGCHFYTDTFKITISGSSPEIRINVFELSTSEPYASYQWLLNGELIPGATNRIYLVKENGAYQVIVSNEYGCIDTSSVYPVSNVKIQSIENLAAQITCYPNPASTTLYLTAPIKLNVLVSGIEGKKIQQWNGVNQISINSLPAGMYLLKISDEEGNFIKTEKFIKSEF